MKSRRWIYAATAVLIAATFYALGTTDALKLSTSRESVDRRPGSAEPLVLRGDHRDQRDAPIDNAAGRTSALRLRIRFPSLAALEGARLLIDVSEEATQESVERTHLETYVGGATILSSLDKAGAPEARADEASVELLLPALRWGRYMVTARTLDRSPIQMMAGPLTFKNPSDRPVDLTLVPSATGIAHVNVVLLRADSSVVKSSVIRVSNEAGFERSVDTGTALHGGIISVPSGAYTVSVISYPGHETLGLPQPQRVVLDGMAVTDLVFRLDPVAQVYVVAESPSGERIQSALSVWERGEDEEWRAVNVTGLFSRVGDAWVGRLPAGRYLAQVSPRAHFAEARQAFDILDGASEVRLVIGVQDSPYPPVRLRLLASDGAPSAQVRVNVNFLADRIETMNVSSATTDVDGIAVTRPLPLGRYAVWLWDLKVMFFLSHTTSGGIHEVRLRELECHPPDDCATLRGVVSRQDGQRVDARLFVLINQEEDANLYTHRFYDSVPLASGGRTFQFDAVMPGTYRLWSPWMAGDRLRIKEYRSESLELKRGQSREVNVELLPESK